MLPHKIPKDTFYHKRFGRFGEALLDHWMESLGWFPWQKNLKIHKGEIDRVYKNQADDEWCVSEVKTLFCANEKKFYSIFTETGLFSLLKIHQLQNLQKYSDYLNSKFIFKSTKGKFHIRLFIILKMYEGYENAHFFTSQSTFKICLQNKDHLILSLKCY